MIRVVADTNIYVALVRERLAFALGMGDAARGLLALPEDHDVFVGFRINGFMTTAAQFNFRHGLTSHNSVAGMIDYFSLSLSISVL